MTNRWIIAIAAAGLSVALLSGCDDGGASATGGDETGDEPDVAAGEGEDPQPFVPPGPVWLDDTLGELPERLSATGAYLDPTDLTVLDERLGAYEPIWPLWTSGSVKLRAVYVPNSEAAPLMGDGESWDLPVGTAFFKSFAYPDSSREGGLHLVETRILVREGNGDWEYGSYVWREDGSDAERVDMKLTTSVPIQLEDGTSFTHNVPARLDCRKCHESTPDPVLGFSRIQLEDGAIDALADRGWLQLPEDPAPALPGDDSLTRDVLAYFQGNCVHCHNGSGLASASFDLRPEVALENIIDVPTESSAQLAGIRVIPGDPDSSVLYMAMAAESDDPELKVMPPLGIDLIDADGVALVRSWILQLEPSAGGPAD